MAAVICIVFAPAVAGSPTDFIYTETARFEPAAADRFPRGAALQVVESGRKRPLVPGFAASADAQVSFDGRSVLFAGKQNAADPWQIWEVAISGGTPRRITAFAEDAATPFYLAGDRIVCARRTSTGYQLEIVSMEGKPIERLTFGPGDHFASGVLRDGRVLFDAPHGGAGAHEIFTIYTDGISVETYRCDHGPDRRAAVETASGDIVFAAGGKLARFVSSKTTQVDWPAVAGEFGGRIAEVDDGDFFAAYRPGKTQPFGIYRWRPGQGVPAAVWTARAAHAVQPVLIRPRLSPNRHPSALGDREGANLLCLNAYTSHETIPAGVVKTVRAWLWNEAGAPTSLGTAAVEKDGSFFITLPSESPVRLELLDGAGKIIAGEKGWWWARRGEQRVCVGCHAGPEHSPENVVPEVLLRSTDPVKLLTHAMPSSRGEK